MSGTVSRSSRLSSRLVLKQRADSGPRDSSAETRPTEARTLDALSPRRREVALCISQGLKNKQIASSIGRSENTVEKHVTDIARIWRLDHSLDLRVQIAVIVTRSLRSAA